MHRNISESTLSKQLRELVDDGFIEHIDYGEVPPRVEYRLTERGSSFVPILEAMKAWGEHELI
ncbi:winged helix-turn-helix transcriptional regulator [Gordonibacter massiliensis (ex Traore et al. 2017)]|uniref:winged helix-turn-helix transcriptional regulator n=1 Tax=Gordonibacter massiliensis (ex Traore et al. 2017) TaxID=1841863 RepID=UPI003F689812